MASIPALFVIAMYVSNVDSVCFEILLGFPNILHELYFQATLRVKCGRVDCPPLNCDEKLAFRPEKRSCCKICPNKTKPFSFDITVSDQQDTVRNDRDILLAGGCKHAYGGPYENGKEWHPQIYFHGVERCVLCRCKVECEFFPYLSMLERLVYNIRLFISGRSCKMRS